MGRWLAGLFVVVIGAGAGIAGYRLLRAELAADVYRERIQTLSDDYQSLRKEYEDALHRTAVTELRVADGKLSVVVRQADGEVHEIPTPYDPTHEIYVDFALVDGRLWIRRVFADDTPPKEGILIDPSLGAVDWDAHPASFGKAAYRTLGEGRWVVTVSGNGALDLTKSESAGPAELSPPPLVREFPPVAADVDQGLGSIGPLDLAAALVDALRGGEEAQPTP